MLKKFVVLAAAAFLGSPVFAQSQAHLDGDTVYVQGENAVILGTMLRQLGARRQGQSVSAMGIACEANRQLSNVNCIQDADRVYAGILRSGSARSHYNSQAFMIALLGILGEAKKSSDPEGVTLADYLLVVEDPIQHILVRQISCSFVDQIRRASCEITSERFVE